MRFWPRSGAPLRGVEELSTGFLASAGNFPHELPCLATFFAARFFRIAPFQEVLGLTQRLSAHIGRKNATRVEKRKVVGVALTATPPNHLRQKGFPSELNRLVFRNVDGNEKSRCIKEVVIARLPTPSSFPRCWV